MRSPRGRSPARRRSAGLAVALALAVVAALIWAQNSTVLVPEIESYSVIDSRTLALRVAVAPCSWTRVTNVAETSDRVRIRVETLPCPLPLPQTGMLEFRDLRVSLTADLGGRGVTDASGNAVHPRAP